MTQNEQNATNRGDMSRPRVLTPSFKISVTVFLALLLVFAFLAHALKSPDAFASKVYELTYQFLLLVVIGGGVSLLFEGFSDERDRIQERRVLLRQMHAELLGAYNTAKRVRRTLRARVGYSSDPKLIQDLMVGADDYVKQMDILMDSQFAFEVFAKRAENPELFFKYGRNLPRIAEELRNI